MKPSKRLLTAVAAIFLLAVLGLSVLANNVKKEDTQENPAVSGAASPSMQQDLAVPDTASPQAKPPVLMIGGKPDDRVYLQSLDIQVEVTGNIASTRYTMVFKNRTDNILEGELTFPLPDERTVTHYALDINGKMREAVPVEKARATQVFEEIQRRQVDPGILERVEGNNFRTRIYPIPRNGTRTVSIGYEEELALEREMLHYRLPMAYPDPLEKFAVKATVWKSGVKPVVSDSEGEIRFDKAGENYVASFARENHRPARALNFALPAPADIPQVMMQSAQGSFYFLASVAPKMEARQKQWGDELAIIWDVSLSGSQRDLKREMEALDIVFAEKKNVDVHLYFLNNRFKKIANKSTANGEYKVNNGDWSGLKKVLETAVFDGGTDFSQINMNDIAGSEILFFSDGISTLSDADFIKKAKINRPVHCVVSSAKADYSAMKLIAGKSKGKFVNINALSSAKLKYELLNETPQFLGAEGTALREVHPSIAAPVHGNFSIAGISGASDAEMTLLFGFGGKVEKRIKVKLDAKSAGKQGNVYKIWAQKKIAELDLEYEKNRAELTELGQQFGIVTRNTSLMVLEMISDYVRYGIEPPASEPELRAEYRRMTGGSGHKPVPRTEIASSQNADRSVTMPSRSQGVSGSQGGGGDPRARITTEGVLGVVSGHDGNRATTSADIFGRGGFAADTDAILSGTSGLKSGGDGGVGRKGAAGIGYGSGYGSGFGGGSGNIGDILDAIAGGGGGGLDLKKSGEMKTSSPNFLSGGSLTGGRSRASIQRVVMQNMAALRHAYNRSLRNKPGLVGKVVVKFAINEFGEVISAQMVESTVNDSALESAVLNRVRSFTFEQIDKPGDVTEVTYPFMFSDGGSGWSGTVTERQDQQSDTERREQQRREAERQEQQRRNAERLEQQRLEQQRRSAERNMLYEAVMAADNLKKWWNVDYAPKMSKFPTPDDNMFTEGNAKGVSNLKSSGSEYLRNMTGKTADDYQIYLKSRNDHANSPTFYFEMADWFYRLGDRETALRVLTSIADLELENASLYRLLGYRFKEYGEYTLQKFVCRKVVQWRPMDPQSHRDYALALADNGEAQAALDSLGRVLTRLYPSANINNRNHGIDEVVVTEINRLIAKNPRLNTSKIDKRLITNIPVDVRVVINWNMNNTDIDLYVKDPTGEECYYSNKRTSIGGRMSADNTSGHGPEQFMLKNAARGKYQIHVNHFSAREFAANGPSTVMAEIYTKYSDKTEQRQVVCLQLANAKRTGDKKVEVAEFDF